jgi:septum site-determining protein MinC
VARQAAPSRLPITFKSRAFRALVLAPETPLADWLAHLDALLAQAPAFFVRRAVILDLSAAPLEAAEVVTLLADLLSRKIRILGIEGGEPFASDMGLPPRLTRGRASAEIEMPLEPEADTAAPPARASLLLESALRSGQSIRFPEGDVTVLGSVASGAEIIAGGSIHVYGALRGRAVAGSASDPNARIYCRKFDPELIGINGLYNTADTVDARFRGKPIQARLNGSAIVLSAMD